MLEGTVESGRAVFARSALSASVDLADGATVEAFVRPHDVRLSKASDAVPKARIAHVERVVRVGGTVKLTVVLPDGDRLSVQMLQHELDAHEISAGDGVVLDLLRFKTARGAQLSTD